MNDILLSIGARHAAAIREGRKTAELRTRPLPVPCRCFVYETKPEGVIRCDFVCRRYLQLIACDMVYTDRSLHEELQLDPSEIIDYLPNDVGFIHYIEEMHTYAPRHLSDFNLDRAPQSWRYLTAENIPPDLRDLGGEAPERPAEGNKASRTNREPNDVALRHWRQRQREEKAIRDQRNLDIFGGTEVIE
ncbi:MAG: ASCH domain-containing protein [Methanomassiliicoccaceae archaeon]|nr:ASCH domain-containing protein [Methanomassiliicoccaceae archaeon]